MKKALMLAPMGSVHRRFNKANIDALQALDYEVELCANFQNGKGPEMHNQKFVEQCRKDDIVCYSIPFERHSLSGSIKCLPVLKQLLAERDYDIVHAHTEIGGLLLKMVGKIKGQKFFTPHGMSFWKGSSPKSQFVFKPLERWICSGMDQNLGMNMEEVEYLQKWDKKSANYVHGIGLNVQRMQSPVRTREEVRKEFGITDGVKMIASIGELDDNKNHSTVIKAFVMTGRKDFKYVVCGVGPNKEMLEQQAISQGFKDNVILAGYRSDIPDVLNAADIFVFPSFHEGMPVSVLEAMACSLPVICSKIRGNVDIIKEGDNGYLFKPADVETLSKKIMLIMDDAEKRTTMGKKNVEFVKRFSLEAVTEELKNIYKYSNYGK